jgi:hypothetical protein
MNFPDSLMVIRGWMRNVEFWTTMEYAYVCVLYIHIVAV